MIWIKVLKQSIVRIFFFILFLTYIFILSGLIQKDIFQYTIFLTNNILLHRLWIFLKSKDLLSCFNYNNRDNYITFTRSLFLSDIFPYMYFVFSCTKNKFQVLFFWHDFHIFCYSNLHTQSAETIAL